MKSAWLIARRELAAFFRTPMGYVIAAITLLIDGIVFNIAVGAEPKLSSDILKEFLFYAGGVTATAAVFLSMRLLSEEQQLVPLFTSPVKESEIVAGKFVSALVFLSGITLLTLYLPALIFVNGKVSVGHIVSGYLGMLLLGAAALALGVLGSALARHQLLALVISGALVVTMHLLWFLSRVADPPLDRILENMAFYYKHFMPFRNGLLQLSDVVYYLSVIWFGLLAATRVLRSRRWA